MAQLQLGFKVKQPQNVEEEEEGGDIHSAQTLQFVARFLFPLLA